MDCLNVKDGFLRSFSTHPKSSLCSFLHAPRLPLTTSPRLPCLPTYLWADGDQERRDRSGISSLLTACFSLRLWQGLCPSMLTVPAGCPPPQLSSLERSRSSNGSLLFHVPVLMSLCLAHTSVSNPFINISSFEPPESDSISCQDLIKTVTFSNNIL